MHILDDIIVKILHQVFDRMKSATSDMIVGSACQKQMAFLQGDLKRVRTENTKANTDYESLKAEVLKAVQGKSALPMEVLNEVLEETRQRVFDTSRRVTESSSSCMVLTAWNRQTVSSKRWHSNPPQTLSAGIYRPTEILAVQ